MGLNDDPPPLPNVLTMPANLLLPEDTSEKMTRRVREPLERNQLPHMSLTASLQGIDRTNARRQETENLISPLRKWSAAPTINSPVLAPPRVGGRELPQAPMQGQQVYDSPRPRPIRARFGTRPRSASLQSQPGQYIDMRAGDRKYLYEPIAGEVRGTIV